MMKWARLPNLSKTNPLFLTFILCLTSLSLISEVRGENCSNKSFDSQALVTQVYDGDTVKLANGDHIRLIGINTPEMNYDTNSPEPYARQAKAYLENQVLHKKIGLKYGREKKDQHKRKLAHIFLPDGTNIQYEILKSGLGFNISFPPNLWQHTCYQNAEKTAKKNKVGVWKSAYYKPVNASSINRTQLGFKRVTGTVNHVHQTKKSVWIQLSEKMSLRINKKDLHYFKNFQATKLIGKKITATGWISFYKQKFSMSIKHPDAISIE